MNDYIQTAKDFAEAHKKKLVLGGSIALGALILFIIAMLFIYNLPKDNYQAVKACDLFTSAEAENLLEDKTIGLTAQPPTITEDTAISKCSYTDSNADKDKMKIAAIAVRSGINDKGVAQNKADFANNTPTENIEDVNNLGEKAYFDKAQGQLNILDGRKWIIISYGAGSTPQFNTLDDAVKLANKVLY